MARTKKTSTQKSESNQYSVTVTVMGKKYTSTGDTVSNAISKIKPLNCKGKCIISVTNGSNTKDRVIMPAIAYRLFSAKGLLNEIAVKQISTLFQGL